MHDLSFFRELKFQLHFQNKYLKGHEDWSRIPVLNKKFSLMSKGPRFYQEKTSLKIKISKVFLELCMLFSSWFKLQTLVLSKEKWGSGENLVREGSQVLATCSRVLILSYLIMYFSEIIEFRFLWLSGPFLSMQWSKRIYIRMR